MMQRLCLMASHGYPPGILLNHELCLPGTYMKGCQTILPSPVPKQDMIRYQSPFLKPKPYEESTKIQSDCFDCNQFVNADFSTQRPMLLDVQASCSKALLFGFGIVERCTEHDQVLNFLKSGTAETGIDGAKLSLLSNLMRLQLSGMDDPQQPLASLIYPDSKFDIQKSLLYFARDSALPSKITVHSDGQIMYMGTGIEMKDLLSVVAEKYLAKNLHKGDKHSVLVPHFSRVNINEAGSRSHSSSLNFQSTLTAPLRSPEKVKLNPPTKKNKKISRGRDLYKKNYSHACEILLSMMIDKKQRRKTAIPSLKKCGPELPELLTQFSAAIAGTGLAVMLSVICEVAYGRVILCASNLLSTGLGFVLVWLSWAVNKLRTTVVSISKNAGKLSFKEEEMIQKLDRSIRDIYFSAAASLAMAMLRLA